jgi:hypothetical protein
MSSTNFDVVSAYIDISVDDSFSENDVAIVKNLFRYICEHYPTVEPVIGHVLPSPCFFAHARNIPSFIDLKFIYECVLECKGNLEDIIFESEEGGLTLQFYIFYQKKRETLCTTWRYPKTLFSQISKDLMNEHLKLLNIFKTKEDHTEIFNIFRLIYSSESILPILYPKISEMPKNEKHNNSTVYVCSSSVSNLDRISYSFIEYLIFTIKSRLYDVIIVPTHESSLEIRIEIYQKDAPNRKKLVFEGRNLLKNTLQLNLTKIQQGDVNNNNKRKRNEEEEQQQQFKKKSKF